ncbi:MAG: 4-alpha-glucanotransferase, partial [Christensenellales bacterium]|nr:4-alpha-glucanotransferase [Christensenellales bacterium]
MERSSGILMHISSLPNRFGIGSIGQCAYDFVDFLAEAKQRYWQILPLGPTGYGDSPYQLFSASAGNPYFIDLDLLVADGLLLEEEVAAHLTAPGPVDYGRLYQQRFPLLRKAFARGRERDLEAQAAFGAAQGAWLEDYALFMALKYHYGMGPFSQWPEAVRLRQPEALAQLKQVCREDVAFYRYLQYLFYTQWDALRSYAKGKGVKLMGDLPIYVSMDSADVWANPQ